MSASTHLSLLKTSFSSFIRSACIAFLFLSLTTKSLAQDIHVAVASNFRPTMQVLVSIYESQSPYNVSISAGSTGKQYAQIVNGAPFDLFFAADAERPRLLEDKGLGVADSRYTYAYGKLALWSAIKPLVGADTLNTNEFKRLSLANPRLAPYGRAAEQTINKLDLRETLKEKKVQGENIAQAFQFVASGNAELGFVAYSQLVTHGVAKGGSYWLVPKDYYENIEQQAIMLRQTPASGDFYAFMQSATASKIIFDAGYDLP